MNPPFVPPDQLRHEQIRLLANNVPSMAVGSILLGAGAVALLHFAGQNLRLALGWFMVNTAITLGRFILARRFLEGAQAGPAADRWARAFIIGSGLAGLWWGTLSWWFLVPEVATNLAVIAIILMGSVSGATQSQGPYFASHMAFTLPCTLPFAARCFMSGDPIALTLGVLSVVYIAMAVLFSLQMDRTVVEALRLRLENEALVAEVSRARDAAEAASRAKTRFLATASHDLRQPIHAMGLFVPALQTMARRGHVPPQALGAVADRMQLAMQTMSQLLGRLLDVSRLDAGVVEVSPHAVALAPLIQTAVDEVTTSARAKGLAVRVRTTDLWARTDPSVLHAILSNLLGNAVRYTRTGGILVAARRRGDSVLLQVWDTGIGIAADDQARLSEEFFQGRNAHETGGPSRGFGLGLAIAQRSASLLGSGLRWRSRLGRGSVFELRLPLAAPKAVASMEPATGPLAEAPAEAPGQGLMLVVDQDEDILASMAFLLKTWGYEALIARSLADVLDVASRHGPAIAGALVDYHLSDDEDGLQIAHALREQLGKDLPLAIVTGDTTPEVMAAVRKERIVLLHKPTNAQALQAFVVAARRTGG